MQRQRGGVRGMVCLFPTSALFTVRRGVAVIHENGKNPLKIRFTENGSKLAQLLTHTHTHTFTRAAFLHTFPWSFLPTGTPTAPSPPFSTPPSSTRGADGDEYLFFFFVRDCSKQKKTLPRLTSRYDTQRKESSGKQSEPLRL